MTHLIKAQYTSVWESGAEITTECLYDTELKKCFQIQISESETSDDDQFIMEYVTLPDGTELDEKSGLIFEW